MNRRILLGVALLVALGGLVYWAIGAGGRRELDVESLVVDGADGTSASAVTDVVPGAIATIEASLANSGRDPRPTKGVGSIVVRIVRKSDGLALVGILVRLEGVTTSGDRVDRRLWTDAKGDVRFDDVVAGAAWDVHVQRDPNPPIDRLGVVVKEGETTDLGRIALEALGIVDALVLDEDRLPIKGATVSVSCTAEAVAELDASPWALDPALPGEFAKGVTDDRGRLRIEGVPPGSVAVRATSENRRGRTFRVFVPAEPPKTAFVVFAVSLGRTYVGRVTAFDGSPIPAALVEFGIDGVERFATMAATRTTADGSFLLRGCDDVGAFSLRASAERFAPVIVTPETWKPIEIVLARGSTLVVRAVDARTRAAVAGARVSVTLPDLDPRRPSRLKFEGRTGADGVAEIEVPSRIGLSLRIVEEGHRTLELTRSYSKSDVRGGEIVGDVGSVVGAGERRELTAALTGGESLWGVVTDTSRPPAPVPDALVQLRHGERRTAEVRTDRDGKFQFVSAFLSDRSPMLAVTARGFYAAEVSVRDGSKDSSGLVRTTVVLSPTEPPVSLVGRIVDADRKPVSGALVRVPERGLVGYSTGSGAFRFAGVARRLDPRQPTGGPITILVEKDRLRVSATTSIPKPVQGDVASFGDVNLIAAIDYSGVTLRGTSSDRTHYPLVDLFRFTGREPPALVESVVGGEFGDFTFTGLPQGRFRIRARDAIGGGKSQMIDVEGGRANPSFIEVRLHDATICAGQIEDSAGKPLEGIVVRLEVQLDHSFGELPSSLAVSVTDAAGAFRFKCFDTSPTRVSFALDPRDPSREIREGVRQGDGNVIRVKNYMKPIVR